jgi:hypothetical protein
MIVGTERKRDQRHPGPREASGRDIEGDRKHSNSSTTNGAIEGFGEWVI